ncbi:tetratricopeptide repeat protein [bacterium]|nr:tetratricopeptide repeat protein [bacterium]MBU1994469.1 tetratricopeptide repeat protein [bacterium]
MKTSTADSLEYLKLGLLCKSKNDAQNAELYFKKAIEIDPLCSDAYENIGDLYKEHHFMQDAKKCYAMAIKLNPNQLTSYIPLGQIYQGDNDMQSALFCFEKALEINPDIAQTYTSIGNLYFADGNLTQAKPYYQKAISLNPASYESYNNFASCFMYQNKLKQAKKYYKKALEINPKGSLSLYNLSLISLLEKEYISGFNQYRHRYSHEVRGSSLGGVAYPPTLLTPNDDISEKTLYISHEQGLGDTIQFIRFLPFFLEKNAHILCYVPPSLKKLFEYNYPEVEFVLPKTNISFDYNFPMLEAPYLLGTSYETIPYGEKYIRVHPEDAAAFQAKHDICKTKKKIGICYRGSQGANAVKNRSLELEYLLSYLNKLQGSFELYSLQYERTPQEDALLKAHNVNNLGVHIQDFYDTALGIDAMDLLISIDTSFLHLCGAMGKESFALVKFSPDWRWGLQGSTSKWYESITIIRQKAMGDWENVLDTLLVLLKEKL